MRKWSRLIILVMVLFFSLNRTIAYYNITDKIENNFHSKSYSIKLNGNGGSFSNADVVIANGKTTLPQPSRRGYTFEGFSSTKNGNVNYSTTINNVDDINNKVIYAKWKVITYSISYNLDCGSISSQPTTYNVENTFTLPQPTKTGYTFAGWIGTGLSSATKSVTISNGIGNRNYTATWTKNYYKVNYYVNGSLWAQRSVGYGDGLENLNGQNALDGYHKFNGWNGWVNNMPAHDVSLTASVTECYCRLITGHGPYGNASGLLSVFQSAGWSGNIQEAPAAPGNYLVITDYNLTRAQAENQKNYIASHTNYTNYSYPYLYWVGVECTNGYGESWTRGLGQSNFN